MRYLPAFLLLICTLGSSALFAQADISPERKRAIDSLAMEKVRDLSKYISIVGNKDTPFSEADRVIDRAVELFDRGYYDKSHFFRVIPNFLVQFGIS